MKGPNNGNKKEIRKKILRLRTSLTREELHKKSARIMEKLEGLDAFSQSSFILCYSDFKNEVKTGDFLRRCLEKGKRLALPSMECESGHPYRMVAYEIFNADKDLLPGFYGICEPKKSSRKPVEPRLLDLIVVPGVAFDPEKNRLGYGGGFFDRFMSRVRSNVLKIGVAFDLQIVDKIPAEAHDVKVDMVITESRIV